MPDLALFLLGGAVTAGLAHLQSRLMTFRAQKAEDYAHLEPHLDLRQALSGTLACDGMIYGPTGRVTARFHAVMEMSWSGEDGVMDERFTYDDGTKQQRQWRLKLRDDGKVEARADDVQGIGRGRVTGNALGLAYRIRLPEASGGHVLDATDWLYLQDDGTLLNRSQFRKFGIVVAELFATVRPMEARDA